MSTNYGAGKGKGLRLFHDFLKAVGELYNTQGRESEWYPRMIAVADARAKLEAYLDPPRDKNGHFVSTQPIKPEGNTQ